MAGPSKNRRSTKRKPGKPAAGSGRGKPKISERARRVAHGFVSASGAANTGVSSEIVDEKGMRLNRWLAEQGVDSRRKCDARIQGGEVEVNGRLCVEPGYRVQPDDDIRINGARVQTSRRLYYLFHKPRGVLCTNDPRETRTRVCDLVDRMVPSRVFTVGRLDEDSEGLLLLTNDGEFSNLVAHPRHGVPKTYVCTVSGQVSGATLDAVRGGAWIDGNRVLPEKVHIMKRTSASTSVEITIREGRNREVRRMLARHGLGVKRLKRVRIGPLGMSGVKRGALRPLSRSERDALVAMARAESPTEADIAELKKERPVSRSSRPRRSPSPSGGRSSSDGARRSPAEGDRKSPSGGNRKSPTGKRKPVGGGKPAGNRKPTGGGKPTGKRKPSGKGKPTGKRKPTGGGRKPAGGGRGKRQR